MKKVKKEKALTGGIDKGLKAVGITVTESALTKLSQIAEGWRNQLIPPQELKGVIAQVSRHRTKICELCIYHSKNHNTIRPDDHCTDCGCTLLAKTKCLSCRCPLDEPKWVEVDVKY